MADWSGVKREHVLAAIAKFDSENPDFPEARFTFLRYNDRNYPAKHIRGMAYEQAHGTAISKQDFTGGMGTVRFFTRRGFNVYYKGSLIPAIPVDEPHMQRPKYKEPENPEATSLPSLKVGLYLQYDEQRNMWDFKKAMMIARQCDADIIVFPEDCYTPFIERVRKLDVLEKEDLDCILEKCRDLSKGLRKPVIVGGMDKIGTLFNVYANDATANRIPYAADRTV